MQKLFRVRSWRTAYVQPSRRPTDGRYGDNPNRLQHYYQFQVILKPSPPDIQDLYIASLQHLGIDPSVHDIRFVEDNWESPTLGAWGLGWEVWLNGMEVTQFTYFQQVGGLECFPVSGEITYGLERIAMYLQGVLKASHYFNLLDARQAISVTERQRFILRVRTLSRQVAETYYESRRKLGFPLAPEPLRSAALNA